MSNLERGFFFRLAPTEVLELGTRDHMNPLSQARTHTSQILLSLTLLCTEDIAFQRMKPKLLVKDSMPSRLTSWEYLLVDSDGITTLLCCECFQINTSFPRAHEASGQPSLPTSHGSPGVRILILILDDIQTCTGTCFAEI